MPNTQEEQTDLFSSRQTADPGEPPVHSVSSLTKQIRDVLESSFAEITVEGEVSNFLHHRSGHRYWTLKDDQSQISCVFWKTRQLSFEVDSGQHIICRGRLTVYGPRGNYQLDVFQVRPVGIGALQLAYEKLFKKLQAEGLFDETRKREIPKFPKRVGVVTSATGAAIHDILTVLRRRYSLVDVLLRPVSVQGIGSELQVAQAIRDFNNLPEVDKPDVLIVGRGGGSLEDLWTFNEEAVARAIYSSGIPIVSAVGHEVDVTIADFVADLRAPTPTAAAELITPDKNELLREVSGRFSTMKYYTTQKISDLRKALISHSTGYGLQYVLKQALESKQDELVRLSTLMKNRSEQNVEFSRLRIDRHLASLRALDPRGVLARGYAILQSADGAVITDGSNFPVSAEGTLHLHSGLISVRRTK
ncbi:MAG TPA: exodeoxyribonuclease VII large subunit [Candidatus Kapabacteria bacterium]|nr:exodeoxyribonuclease VII large subunit [Candidatus Kapabacteria bacterium]